MFKVISVLSIILLTLLIAFLWFIDINLGLQYFVLILLLLILFLSDFGNFKQNIPLLAISTFGVCLLGFKFHIPLLDRLFIVSLYWLGGLIIAECAGYENAVSEFQKERMQKKKNLHEKLNEKFENLYNSKIIFDKRISQLSKVYEISKRMSFELNFNSTLNILGEFLRENFDYLRVRILVGLTQEEAGKKGVVKEYVFYKNGDNKVSDRSSSEYPAWKNICKLRKSAVLKRKNDSDKMNKLEIDAGVSTAVVSHLGSENEYYAYIIFEEADINLIDTFSIISNQLSLQLKKVKLYENVERLSIIDGLTGAYRRHYFISRLDEEIERSKKLNLNFSLLMIDIDNFKDCNDTYGHLVGDITLKAVSAVMNKEIREMDLLGRYGGEEFTIILPETGIEGAVRVAERIRSSVEKKKIKAFDEKLSVTISIGCSVFPDDGRNRNGLIEKSDIQLYSAKRKGKNRVCYSCGV